MNKFIYILLLSISIISCTSNTIIKKPDNLIPKDQMVELLTDLLIATNAKHVKNLNLERKVNYFPLVFEKYNIDSTRFKESNYYYTSNFDVYDKILEAVKKRLESMKEEIEMEIKLQDSIKNSSKDTIKDSPSKYKITDKEIVPQVK